MKQTNNNWKNALVIGMLACGSVMAGCKDGNRDYKMDSDAPAGNAATMDTTQGTVVDESMNSQDNTSPATQEDKSGMNAGANMATGSKAIEPGTAEPNRGTATMPRKARYRATINWKSMNASNMKAVKGADGVYTTAEVMPMYPGGEEALRKFVEENIEYPDAAVQEGEEGRVQVVFTVDEKGQVSNAKVMKTSTDHQLQQEAKDVVMKMPDWTPGKVNGKNVKTRLTLPITYRIEE